MQGLLSAAKLPSSGSIVSKAAVQAGSRGSTFALGRQGKVTSARPQARTHSAANVTATAAVAEPSSQAVAPVTLPPPSRKVKKSINDAEYQFKFIVPDVCVGAFLGKGGVNVNRVKEETGVYVQFTKPGTAVNTEKDRMLILAADTVEQAKQAVEMLLEGASQVEGALARLRTPATGDRLFLQLVIPAICAGNIMGPGGETIKGIGARTGSSLLVEPKMANAAFIPFRLVDVASHDITALTAAVGEVMERLVQDANYSEGIRDVQSVCVRIVKIPHVRVGAILGPGGSYIKALQEMLKVKIGVSEPAGPNPESRYVTLWGSPLNVKVAIDVVMLSTGTLQVEMMKRSVASEARQRRGGDGGDSSNGDWTPRSSSSSSSYFSQRRRGEQPPPQQQPQQHAGAEGGVNGLEN